MKHVEKALKLVLLVGLLAWAVADTASAQRVVRNGGGVTGTGFQYVIKFVCENGGLLDVVVPMAVGAQGVLDRVSRDLPPGSYFTDINIHNPNAKQVKFRKKVALVGEEPEQHGLQTSPVDVILGADEALEINCDDIERLTFGERRIKMLTDGLAANSVTAQQGFPLPGEGYVVLYSLQKLDVAAVYTACGRVFDEEGLSVSAAGPGVGFQPCVDPTLQVDELIPPSPVPAPGVFIRGLSASAAGVNVTVEPFSPVGYDGAQLSIYDQNGRLLHAGDFTAGTQLSWKPLAGNGRELANGVYFYVVGVRDVLGNVSYKTGKFALLR